MISPVALSVYVSSAVAIKIEMIARSEFKAVQMLVVGYAEFRNRYLSNGGKCRAMGFATGCAVTVNDAPHLGRKFMGYVATETAT